MNALLMMLAMVTAGAREGYSVQLVTDDPVGAGRWGPSEVDYWIELAGSDDFAPEIAVAAVRRAFATWTEVGCATIRFRELGDVPDANTTMLSGEPRNGKNEVVWIEDDSWSFGQYVLGVTAPVIGDGGVIVEADVAFNGKDVLWTMTGTGGMDLEGVALHELGHFIGIQHNLGPYLAAAPPTMAPYATADAGGRTLEADDRAAACYLYPETPWTCAGDADCPLFMNQRLEADERIVGWQPCNRATGKCEGIVRYVQRLVGFGERCLTVDACVEGLVCHPFPGGVGTAGGAGAAGSEEVVALCTTPCQPHGAGGDCPLGYRCAAQAPPLDDAGMCVPVDGVVFAPGDGPSGCFSNAECGPGRGCVASPNEAGMMRCAAGCTLGEAGCPAGLGCVAVAAGVGACFAVPGDADGVEGDVSEVEVESESGAETESEIEVETESESGVESGAEVESVTESEPSGGRGTGGCEGGAAAGVWVLLGLVPRARRVMGRPRA